MRTRVWRRSVLVMALLAGASGCDPSDFGPGPDRIPADEIIDVTQWRAPAVMPADGTSLDTIFAWLPADADARLVTFKATAGRFEHFGSEKTATARAVPYGGRLRATVVFIADTVPGVAVVRGTIAEFSDFVEVELTPLSSPGGQR